MFGRCSIAHIVDISRFFTEEHEIDLVLDVLIRMHMYSVVVYVWPHDMFILDENTEEGHQIVGGGQRRRARYGRRLTPPALLCVSQGHHLYTLRAEAASCHLTGGLISIYWINPTQLRW